MNRGNVLATEPRPGAIATAGRGLAPARRKGSVRTWRLDYKLAGALAFDSERDTARSIGYAAPTFRWMEPPIMVRRILVPVDFSTASARTVAVARDYRPEGAVIRLLHVLSPSQLASDASNPRINALHAKDIRDEAEEGAMSQLRAWALEDEEVALEIGGAADKISEHADGWDADMIAMGTRIRTGLSQYLQGSATEWLVRHAKQPVLVVHDVELDPEQSKHLPPME